jgi:hypothetical protein
MWAYTQHKVNPLRDTVSRPSLARWTHNNETPKSLVPKGISKGLYSAATALARTLLLYTRKVHINTKPHIRQHACRTEWHCTHH